MFNYYDTHLVEKKPMLESGVPAKLELLCDSIIATANKIKDSGRNGHLMPAHVSLDALLSISFYINKYIEAHGLDVNKYLEIFDDAVWGDSLSTGNGKKVNVLYDRPMFVANACGNSSTLSKVFELLEYDISLKAKEMINQKEGEIL